MSREKVASEVSKLNEALVDLEESFQGVISRVKDISGPSEKLKDLQRSLMLISRDASDVACSLFSAIQLAESEEFVKEGD